MGLGDLTLEQWRGFDEGDVLRIARDVAREADGEVVAVEEGEHRGGRLYRVRVARGGREFALVPGGAVQVGFDLEGFEPAPDQAADYTESTAQGFGYGADLREHLARVLSPWRSAELRTVLMAVADEKLTEAPADMPAALAAQGLRMPTADEWEHACGAGAGTLFRWGNDCPLDRIPYGDRTGPHRRANAFGLRIAHDTYSAELTGDTGAVHGGDGGESVCGGYGTLLAWLPLATANRNPGMADLVYGPDGEDMWEDCSTRPVLDL
jgi:hypothetical protein